MKYQIIAACILFCTHIYIYFYGRHTAFREMEGKIKEINQLLKEIMPEQE